MRTTRLLAVMMELSRSRRTTVRHLADRHQVSTRTIQRDLVALHGMGVPVWTRTGPDGGVGLIEGWSSPVTGMTSFELQSLVIGEAASRDLGLLEDFERARLKMLSTTAHLPEAVQRSAERFLADHGRWFAPREDPPALATVARAVWTGRRLTIGYGEPGRFRVVDPLGLVLKTDLWYLVAAHRRRPRTYRLSRILSARIHEERSWRPDDFSLAEYWQLSRAAFEASVYRLEVRLTLPSAAADRLRAEVPGPSTAEALDRAVPHGDRLEVILPMEGPDIALAQLLQVPGLEVLSPAELRRRIRDRAVDIAARHAPPG